MEVINIVKTISTEKQKELLEAEKEKLVQEELERLRKEQSNKDK